MTSSSRRKNFRTISSVGIVGLGYVGLPLALRFLEVGIKVIGFDIDQQKIDAIHSGKSYIKHIADTAIERGCKLGFTATTDYSRAGAVDALIVCVPTPLNKHREPDLTFVLQTTDSLVPYLRRGQIFSLESTTYPGTTDEELKPRIESRGLKIGEDIFLVFSPEREDPGNLIFTTRSIPKIVGGCTAECLKAGIKLYKLVIDEIVPVSSTRTAELTKLLENIHRAVNIGLANEMKMIADAMNIDIHEVIRAAATKPFGFVPYYPGPGLGGHCVPIDPFYLTWKAREFGLHTRFIELAGEINRDMPKWVLEKLGDALNYRRKAIKGSRILILGISYKKNVDDTRESPSVELIRSLVLRGAYVDYSDPWVPFFNIDHEPNLSLNSVDATPNLIAKYDAVLIATDHDAFDYKLILKYAKLIVDTRGVFLTQSSKVVKA